jgi:nucleoside-diphosphate-sugar epimerase
MPQRHALVLGASSRIGAALIRSLKAAGFAHAVLADRGERLDILRNLVSRFGRSDGDTSIVAMDPEKPFAGLDDDILARLAQSPLVVFHLAHLRDRALPAADIRRTNSLMLERALAIAYRAQRLTSLTIVTDAGLVGDYPGRFSENWIDVGQTPFDEVDRSSMEIEIACTEERAIPIVRARVGLVLDSIHVPEPSRYWPSPSDVLLRSVGFLKKLPRFVTVPAAVAKGAMAPISPADWSAEVLLDISQNREAIGTAVHLVIDAPPSMDRLLEELSRKTGGARIRGGLPADIVAKLGIIPGFKELARRNADQIASWWTPHRYCLSRNDLDTSHLRALLQKTLFPPSWASLKRTIS